MRQDRATRSSEDAGAKEHGASVRPEAAFLRAAARSWDEVVEGHGLRRAQGLTVRLAPGASYSEVRQRKEVASVPRRSRMTETEWLDCTDPRWMLGVLSPIPRR